MLFFSGQPDSSSVYRKAKKNELIPVCTGVFTDDFDTPLEAQVRKNIFNILAHQKLRGIFAYRSAIQFPDFDESDDIVIISDRKRDVILPGMIVHVYAGNDREKKVDFTTTILTSSGEKTYMRAPCLERSVLENLLPQRMAEKRSDIGLAIKSLEKIVLDRGQDIAYERFDIVAETCGLADALPYVSEKMLEITQKTEAEVDLTNRRRYDRRQHG